KCLGQLFAVDVPVAQAVQGVSQRGAISHGARDLQGLPSVFPGPGVVAAGPQMTEVEQELAFCALIAGGARELRGRREVGVGAVEISQDLVRVPTAPVEASGYGSGQAARGGNRLREVLDRRQRRIHAQGLLTSSA